MSSDLFFFDRAEMVERAKLHAAEYRSAEPFPHVALEDLFPQRVADQIAQEFPRAGSGGFVEPVNAFQSKKRESIQNSDFTGVSPTLRHILNEFNSRAFLEFLETLTGISGLIPDPHLNGGGLHQILPGGKLAIHADFNLDPRRKLQRRVNVLVYFNADWKDEYGGHLELWSRDMSRCVRKIAPMINRCVVFNTTSDSFHGHPEPLACPPGTVRNSMAFYYYTALDAETDVEEHTTLWRSRPGVAEPSGEGDRIYYRGLLEDSRVFLKRQIKPWIPPALLKTLRRLKK